MNIEKELKKQIKTFKGNLLVIGTFNDSIVDFIKKNKSIYFCDILTNNVTNSENSSEFRNNNYLKIDEIKKKYKKKNINYILCKIDDVSTCFPIFFRDVFSIYNNKLYLYVSKKSIIELEKKLNKHSIKYEIKEDKDSLLYIIDSKKISFIKSNLIYIENKLEEIIDILSNIIEGS